jgi:hypothetical protein
MFFIISCSNIGKYSDKKIIGEWKSTKENLYFECTFDNKYIFYDNPKTKEHLLNHNMKYEFNKIGLNYELVTFFLDDKNLILDKARFDVFFYSDDSISVTPIINNRNEKGTTTSFTRITPPLARN